MYGYFVHLLWHEEMQGEPEGTSCISMEYVAIPRAYSVFPSCIPTVFPRIPTNMQLTEDHLEYVES